MIPLGLSEHTLNIKSVISETSVVVVSQSYWHMEAEEWFR